MTGTQVSWLPLLATTGYDRGPIWRNGPTPQSLRRLMCELLSWLCRCPHGSLTWWNLVPAWSVCWPTLSSLKALACGDDPHPGTRDTGVWGCREYGKDQLQSNHLGHQWQTDFLLAVSHGGNAGWSPLWLFSALFHCSSPFSHWEKHRDSPGHLPHWPSIL